MFSLLCRVFPKIAFLDDNSINVWIVFFSLMGDQ